MPLKSEYQAMAFYGLLGLMAVVGVGLILLSALIK
jgi:hypothetical protein